MIATKQADPAAEQWLRIFQAFFAYWQLPGLEVAVTTRTRTFFRNTGLFQESVRLNTEGQPIVGGFGAAIFRRWDMVGNHGSTARWGVRVSTYRFSPQLVWHSSGLIECDVDLYNPDAGAYFAAMHALHDCALRRSRNPWRMRAGLMKTWPGLKIPLVEAL
jgi:hypothetical protein